MRDRYMQFNHLRFVRSQRLLDGRLEPWPQTQFGDEHIAHHLFDMAIAICERLNAGAERLDETGLVALAVQAKGERLLTGFDDFVRAHHNDAGYQLDGNALLEQVDDKDARGQELNAAQEICNLSAGLRDYRKSGKLTEIIVAYRSLAFVDDSCT